MKLPAGTPPPWLLACQRFLQWGGVWGGTLVLTAVATAFSALYSTVLILWLEPKNFQQMIVVGLLVPILLTPPIAFIVMTLLNALSAAHKTVQLLADRDVLTDAYTRRYFLSKVNERLSRENASTAVDSVVLLDVDNFKRINDQHGHPVGDAVLRAISQTCRNSLREKDIFARYGGEEFVLLLQDATPQQALDVAERIRLAIHQIRVQAPNGEQVSVSASFGIAGSVIPEAALATTPVAGKAGSVKRDAVSLSTADAARTAGRSIERILSAADKALYEAKHRGKDRTILASDIENAWA